MSAYVPFTKYHEQPLNSVILDAEPTEAARQWSAKQPDQWHEAGHGLVKAMLHSKDRMATPYLSDIIKTALWGLIEKGQKGDKRAQAFMLNALFEALSSLYEAASRDPEKFKAVAEKATGWPLVFNPHPEYQRRQNDLLKRLNVGGKSKLKIRGGKRNRLWSLDTPAARWAYQGLQIVTANRDFAVSISIMAEARGQKLPQWVIDASKLPELSKKTAAQWFAVCWDAMLHAFPKIDKDPDWNKAKYGDNNTGTRRGKIYDSIRQAFVGIVSDV